MIGRISLLNMHILTGLGAVTALFLAFPLAAQSSNSGPETSAPLVKQGRPVIAIPSPRQQLHPILRTTIAPEKRGDLSTCNARDEASLNFVAETCWPVLQAYQDLIRLQQASKTAIAAHKSGSSDAEDLISRAIAIAVKSAERNGAGRWPMQDEIAQGTYRASIAIFKEIGDHDAALAAYDGLIRVQARSLMNGGAARRGYIYKNKTEYLLELGRRDEALANFTAATALADREPIDMISNVEHAEIIAYDAIIAKDEDRALDAINMFMEKTKRHSSYKDLVYFPLQRLRLYIMAGRKDHDGVLAQLQAFDGPRHRNMCRDGVGLSHFPQLISPTHSDPRIAAELVTMGCSAEYIAKAPKGPPVLTGAKPLPRR